MTTLDEKSQAEIDSLVTDMPGEIIDCVQCGRNCKHTPNAGGGTAGGKVGEKYTPTARSEARCPACEGKPHRKEGRIYQEISCQYRQAMQAVGATEMLHPNEAIYLKLAEMARDGLFRKVPSEKEITNIVREKMGLPPLEPKRRVKIASEQVPQDKAKDEVPGVAEIKLDASEAITLDTLELPAPAVFKDAIKKKEAEEKAAEKARVKAEKEKKKAEEKAAKEAAKATGTPASTEEAEAPKKRRKAKGADAADAAAEAEIASETPATPIDESEIDGLDEVGYNPFAGVGMPVPEDDEDDEELTPAQQASLAKFTK